MEPFLNLQANYLSLSLLLPSTIALVLAIEAWRPRYAPRGKLFSALMVTIFVWSAAYGFELAGTEMGSMRFWLKIEYLAIPFVTPLMLLVAMQFAGIGTQLKWQRAIYLFIIPVIIMVMSITNEHHHLFYTNIEVSTSGPTPLLELSIGPFYYLHVVYAYLLSAYALYVVIQKLVYQRSLFRNQMIFMLIGVAIPLASFTLYFAGLMPLENLDPTPFAFAFSGIAMSISIMKFRMLDLMPIAREHVFQSMSDGLVVIDGKHRLVDCNPITLKIFGWQKAPFGQTIDEVWAAHKPLAKAFLGNSFDPFEHTIVSNNVEKHYLVSVSPIKNHKERLIGKLVSIHDITHRYVLQQNLRRSEEKLRQLNAEKDKLFSVIAHDLRGPIGNFMRFTELFVDESIGMDKEEMHEVVVNMNKSASSLFGLLENLLTWSRMQRDDVQMETTAIDLRKNSHQTLELMCESAKHKKIEIVNTIPEGLKVIADANMLGFILRNLVSNAIKFTASRGLITISTKVNSEKAIVSIKDTGIGMDATMLKNLYNLQQKTGRQGTDGEPSSGLGLILVKEFVERQGGELTAESELNKGSVFSFSLPLAMDPAVF